MSLNFAVFWALPVMGMGSVYKLVSPVLKPLYDSLDQSPAIRKFAADYVYSDPRHADYFVLSAVVLVNCLVTISTMFYVQLTTGTVPWWLIAAYFCSWVGMGGTTMGTVYAVSHKEVRNAHSFIQFGRSQH
jgi:hypothetical protein